MQNRDGFGKTYCECAQGDVIGRVCAPCPLIVAQRHQAHKGHCPGQKPDPRVLVHSPLHDAQWGENRSQCMTFYGLHLHLTMVLMAPMHVQQEQERRGERSLSCHTEPVYLHRCPQRGAGHLACIWRTDGNDRIVLHLPMDDVHCIWCEVALRMCSCRNTMPGSLHKGCVGRLGCMVSSSWYLAYGVGICKRAQTFTGLQKKKKVATRAVNSSCRNTMPSTFCTKAVRRGP